MICYEQTKGERMLIEQANERLNPWRHNVTFLKNYATSIKMSSLWLGEWFFFLTPAVHWINKWQMANKCRMNEQANLWTNDILIWRSKKNFATSTKTSLLSYGRYFLQVWLRRQWNEFILFQAVPLNEIPISLSPVFAFLVTLHPCVV